MPLVNIKVLQGAFSEAQRVQLIGDITEAFTRVGGAGIRPAVHVIIEEVADGMWGIGGELHAASDQFADPRGFGLRLGGDRVSDALQPGAGE